ncbi:MAG: hypothetical protein JWR37_589 [Mycobacterium sp.]|nr:hypothetical protein [Mycobacterium sp.]
MNARKGLLAPSRARASGALVAPIFSAMPVSVSSSRDPGSNSLLYTLGLSLPAEQHARANQMAPSGRHCPSSAAGDSTWCEIYGQDCHRPAGRRDRSSRRPLSGSRSITLPVSGRNDNKEAIGALPTPTRREDDRIRYPAHAVAARHDGCTPRGLVGAARYVHCVTSAGRIGRLNAPGDQRDPRSARCDTDDQRGSARGFARAPADQLYNNLLRKADWNKWWVPRNERDAWFLRNIVVSANHLTRFSESLRQAHEHGLGRIIPANKEVLIVPRPTVRFAEGQPGVFHPGDRRSYERRSTLDRADVPHL